MSPGHVLDQDEIAQFRADGFLIVENVFPEAEVEALRRVIESPPIQEALAKRQAQERTVHLIPITTRHEAFRELSRDRRITQRVAQLIGDDIQLSNSKLATKPTREGAGAFDWHQDFAYYTSTNYDLLSVSIAIDDVTPDNGGMSAVRGSHELGLLDHNVDGWMTGACKQSRYWQDQPEKVVPLACKAGGISIHHCLTLHGSPANRSGKPRRLVVFQYRAGDCYQLADNTWDDTGFQVYGKPGGRVRCAAMDVPVPKNRGWERYSGEAHGSAYRQVGPRARQWNAEAANQEDR